MVRLILSLLLIAATVNMITAHVFPIAASASAAPENGLGLSGGNSASGTHFGGHLGNTGLKLLVDTSSALLSLNNMAPGDQVTSLITARNEGTFDLRYAIVAVVTDTDGKGLMNQLRLTIKSGVTTCTNSGYKASGTILYGPGILGSPSGINVVGNPATGDQIGDRILRTGESETLCFNVTLPLKTSNDFQNARASATFNFVAEQTINR